MTEWERRDFSHGPQLVWLLFSLVHGFCSATSSLPYRLSLAREGRPTLARPTS